jgi:DNA-binding NarL/FixJ family response regulator
MIDRIKLIGRRRELEELQHAFDAANKERGKVVFISGEAGVGKTLLAEKSLVQSGLKVYTGRTIEEATPPYGPIATVLRDCMRETPGGTFDCGPLTPYLALLLPELGKPAKDPDRETIVEAISSALSSITTRGPAAIFLDDLHWADEATLELLPDLADRLQYQPLLFLGTYRSDEVPRGHRLRWVRNELRRRRKLQEIFVEPLSLEESAVLMERVLEAKSGPELVEIVHKQTQGVPLFVEELSNALIARHRVREGKKGLELIPGEDVPIPESIRDAIILRLDTLTDEARSQLEVAAVMGMEFDLNVITKLAGKETGLDGLFERNLIVETEPGRAAFRHALTREAVRGEIMWSRRRTLNRQIAEYLESTNAPPELIAERWLAANESAKARVALIACAERSCQIHAYRDAARAGHQALEIWPEGEDEETRLETLERLAHCAQISGQLSDAGRALREVAESPHLTENHQRRGEALRSLAAVYSLQGAWEQSQTSRKSAAEAFEKAGLFAEAAVERLAAAGRYFGMLQLPLAIEFCDKALELARKVNRRDLEARVLGLKGNVLAVQGKFQEGIDIVNQGLSIALKYKLADAASEVYRRLGGTLEYASEYTSSREVYTTAYSYCQNQGEEAQAQLCLSCMSYILFRTGDWKRCIEVCQEVINDKKAGVGGKTVAMGILGAIRSYRGETRQARKYLQDSLSQSQRDQSIPMQLVTLWSLAQVEEYEGEVSKAEEYYRQLLTLWGETRDIHDALPGMGAAATFFANRGFEKEATLCADALAKMASVTGNHEALATLAHALGEIALLQGNAGEAARQFLQAMNQFEKLELPVERLKAEFRAGMTFIQAGQQDTGIEHLMSAYRLARNLGARQLASHIAAELDKLGIMAEERRSPEAPERAIIGGLTRRQVEIARLIADGLTNKEIADKLFLSPRTVEMHVANMLNRLDCRSRSEAVRKASELGLLD